MILSGVLGLFTLQWGLNRVSGKRDQAFPVTDPYCCPWVPRCGGFGRQGVSEKTDAWTTPSLVPQNMEAKSRLCNLDADPSWSGPGPPLYVSPLASFPLSHAFLQQIFQLILFSQGNLATHKGGSSSSFSHGPMDALSFLLHWPVRVQLVASLRRSTSIPTSSVCSPFGPRQHLWIHLYYLTRHLSHCMATVI